MDRRLALLLLCLLPLTACSGVRETADRASGCVALARDVASAGLDSTPTQAEAEEAVRRLDERVEQLDDPQVREAAGRLRDRLRELQEAVATGDPTAVQQAAGAARAAARDVASACSLPVDQFLG